MSNQSELQDITATLKSGPVCLWLMHTILQHTYLTVRFDDSKALPVLEGLPWFGVYGSLGKDRIDREPCILRHIVGDPTVRGDNVGESWQPSAWTHDVSEGLPHISSTLNSTTPKQDTYQEHRKFPIFASNIARTDVAYNINPQICLKNPA